MKASYINFLAVVQKSTSVNEYLNAIILIMVIVVIIIIASILFGDKK